MRTVLRIFGPILVCLILVEGSFHTDGFDGHETSGEEGCFLCTFMSGAEAGPPPASVEPFLFNLEESVLATPVTGPVSPEPLTFAGSRSPPA